MVTKQETDNGCQVKPLVMRFDLDTYKDVVIAKALSGECEGSCEEHIGDVSCVRIYDKQHSIDWGWFAYCEEAINEDLRRGMSIIATERKV